MLRLDMEFPQWGANFMLPFPDDYQPPEEAAHEAASSPSSRIRAGKRGFCDFSDGQVIDLERVRPSVLAENGCSEDLPDSQARDGADRFGRIMFLRRTERKKNGKAHSYWNVVENKRLDDGRVVQRHVLYLGEINSSQAAAWRKAIEVFDEDAGRSRTLALFPEDRCEAIASDTSVVQLRLSEMQLLRPRQWGACWLAGQLWQELQLDRFWADRLPPSRKGTRWDQILQVLASYRLIAPGSEWRLHRQWFGNSAMADLLGADFGVAEEHKLYACHDLLLQHKEALFSHLLGRWRDLFNADFDVLLYDLTSTYFEVNASDLPEGSKRRHGYSRDKRPDCPQVVIALVVTPDGLPLAYEVLPGNTA